tara:strand:- start:2272 stop:2805 length:534 start_codon:yes stop_codon:yes gene_type:complete
MDFINLRSVFNRKVSAKNPLLFIYKTVGQHYQSHSKGMKKNITEQEAESTDLALEYLLTFDETFLLYTRTFIVFNKFGINNERAEFICEKLNILKVVELKHQEKRRASIHFNKDTIKEFLAKGGMTNIWLEREEKRVNIKLINKTLKDYFLTKIISWLSFAIAGILAALEIIKWTRK